MLFSTRNGYKNVVDMIQRVGMSQELRTSLWNVLDLVLWSNEQFMSVHESNNVYRYIRCVWSDYFKRPVDEIDGNFMDVIRRYFFDCYWYEVYDFIEFTVSNLRNISFESHLNKILERELSAYRMISGRFVEITCEEEVEMLENALIDNEYPGVKAHLRRSLELLSDRNRPDYRNSIKESICAIESLARELTGKQRATLGDALKIMERNNQLHPALKDAFLKLYGYTSDESGIRHAMLEEPDISLADARFILMVCTSFINYVKSTIDR